MKGGWNALVLALIVVLVGGTIGFYLSPAPDTGSARIMKHMKLGLDLKGGAHIVLEGVDSELGAVTPEKVQAAKAVIENRINALGVSEPLVQVDGKNRIIVEIAGAADIDEARETIGKTAALRFLDPEGNEVLTGKDVEKAGVAQNPTGAGFIVTLKLKGEGPQKFYEATSKWVGQPIYIMLDEDLISWPVVNEPIPGGEATITGNFTVEEASQLATLINGGALPIKLVEVEARMVSATLGADSIAKSLRAGAIGMIGVLLFMMLLYRIPGFLADVALGVYAILNMIVLLAIGNVFTLPGIAGVLLGIGMAVDGNVIIFERIKEELRKGKGLRSGIDAGFHRAYVTVLDSQVTTAIAAAILWYLGTGPVRGFAVTLFVGTVLSMFTAVTFSRWLIKLAVNTGWFNKRTLFGVKEVAE
ncbi:preprotein translocase subunit SecD [Symbiobacterium terraclitae]|uniref:Protein translocase subunit SecD n=1 Tax=Symbiobacterium terraclitae TaxID=557451 RepID=A0ABS4JRU1_9FIRM|nr:protein translocase subunit SecD [Symbiobacterium terraclitae]MBP2018251.1 preprotein translocase subunit SecD [Symbiobacterium terraclitae]